MTAFSRRTLFFLLLAFIASAIGNAVSTIRTRKVLVHQDVDIISVDVPIYEENLENVKVSKAILLKHMHVAEENVPTSTPTSNPTSIPTSTPTGTPSAMPSEIDVPTSSPTAVPSSRPTSHPTVIPTSIPTSSPTAVPSVRPTSSPTARPTSQPTSRPTQQIGSPSSHPTTVPSSPPSFEPSTVPTPVPSAVVSSSPSTQPTTEPSASVSSNPTVTPSQEPSTIPSTIPSSISSVSPSSKTTLEPSSATTAVPTEQPTSPSASATVTPSSQATISPTSQVSAQPTTSPSQEVTTSPSSATSVAPSAALSSSPTNHPSQSPSSIPTIRVVTPAPSSRTTLSPTRLPSGRPTLRPTLGRGQTYSPTVSHQPTLEPTISHMPTSRPTRPPDVVKVKADQTFGASKADAEADPNFKSAFCATISSLMSGSSSNAMANSDCAINGINDVTTSSSVGQHLYAKGSDVELLASSCVISYVFSFETPADETNSGSSQALADAAKAALIASIESGAFNTAWSQTVAVYNIVVSSLMTAQSFSVTATATVEVSTFSPTSSPTNAPTSSPSNPIGRGKKSEGTDLRKGGFLAMWIILGVFLFCALCAFVYLFMNRNNSHAKRYAMDSDSVRDTDIDIKVPYVKESQRDLNSTFGVKATSILSPIGRVFSVSGEAVDEKPRLDDELPESKSNTNPGTVTKKDEKISFKLYETYPLPNSVRQEVLDFDGGSDHSSQLRKDSVASSKDGHHRAEGMQLAQFGSENV